jgi:hypothetical protein
MRGDSNLATGSEITAGSRAAARGRMGDEVKIRPGAASLDRRQFVSRGSLAAGWMLAAVRARAGQALESAENEGDERIFRCDDAGLMNLYTSALATLRGNVTQLPGFTGSVLAEGSRYAGVWMESGPQEGLVYSEFGGETARAAARNNHLIFFGLQNDDGQIPYAVKRANGGGAGGPGWSQIQMVVPIAATAWETAHRSGDSELLEKAYGACARWDAWLRRYRNTRGTGLCEGFCTYDTGMDNSPRWKGEPNRCAEGDARVCPQGPGLPRLSPDLSATVFGGRLALAAMADALEKTSEAGRWTEDAEAIRKLIVDRLCDPRDGGFYDLDAQGRFVRVRSAAILRVLGEHVPEQSLFATVWERQAHNPKAFWANYPFPSVALDDPAFERPAARNSWAGAAQALTALRAPRWMEHYGKSAELAWLMQRWVEALGRARDFRQQMDPLSGAFTADAGGYSPAALVLLDFVWRLSGVREQGDAVEWNVRPPAQGKSQFTARVHRATAELRYDGDEAEMRIGGKSIARVQGVVRMTTTPGGELRAARGISEESAVVRIAATGRPERMLRIGPNEQADLSGSG